MQAANDNNPPTDKPPTKKAGGASKPARLTLRRPLGQVSCQFPASRSFRTRVGAADGR